VTAPPRKLGRPRRMIDVAGQRITFRCTDAERAQLEAARDLESPGLLLTQWIRRRLGLDP